MQITGTDLITGSLVLEIRNDLLRAYQAVTVTSGITLEVSDAFRFSDAITHAVTAGLITIGLEPEDEAVQEDLTAAEEDFSGGASVVAGEIDGTVAPTPFDAYTYTVTFDTSFTDALYAVSIGLCGGSGPYYAPVIRNKTSAGFEIYLLGAGAATPPDVITWMATETAGVGGYSYYSDTAIVGQAIIGQSIIGSDGPNSSSSSTSSSSSSASSSTSSSTALQSSSSSSSSSTSSSSSSLSSSTSSSSTALQSSSSSSSTALQSSSSSSNPVIDLFWTEVTADAPWSVRAFPNGFNFNNQIWIVGGQDGGGVSDAWYSNDGSSWTQAVTGAGFGETLWYGQALLNGTMFLYGGYNNSAGDVWRSTDGITWLQSTSVPHRQSLGSCAFNDLIWLFGGYDPNANVFYNDVWSSPDGIIWTQVLSSAPWVGRSDFAVIPFNGLLWLFGGDINGGPNNGPQDVWSSPDGITWTQQLSTVPWGFRYGYQMAVINGILVLLGGSDGNNRYNDTWTSPDGLSWTQQASGGWSPREVPAVVAFNNQLWLMGGFAGDTIFTGGPVNDVWMSNIIP